MKTSIIEDVGDGAVTHWRIDKIKDEPPFDADWEPSGVEVTLKTYPHSGSHAMKVAWERHEKLFRRLYREGYVLAPQQINEKKRRLR